MHPNSNHADWSDLHTETAAPVGSAHRYGGREFATPEANWRLQAEAQQEDPVDSSNIMIITLSSTSSST